MNRGHDAFGGSENRPHIVELRFVCHLGPDVEPLGVAMKSQFTLSVLSTKTRFAADRRLQGVEDG